MIEKLIVSCARMIPMHISGHTCLASATLILHPPEKVLVALRIMASSKDRPDRMVAALASAPGREGEEGSCK